jgi:NAD(P)-dependent dehydrogenase (short-subunit alcohol dehydrogenase family)
MTTKSMIGKTALVTGSSTGVGFVTARALAERGATVLMVSRDPERAAAARDAVSSVATGPAPRVLLADLSSMDSVRALASDVGAQCKQLDVLVNNAAGVFRRREMTVDGVEKTLATNHLAPFLLTNLLLDRVRSAPAGRIVNVASESHASTIDWENLESERGYNFFKAYLLSKACNLLFTYELARRLAGTPVTVNAVSPGPTMTSFGRGEGGALAFMRAMMRLFRLIGIASTPERGARTMIHLACSDDVAGVTGRFFLRGRERKTRPITYDADVAARLWRMSEALSLPDHPVAHPRILPRIPEREGLARRRDRARKPLADG